MELSGFVDDTARKRFARCYDEVFAQRWPPHERTEIATSFGPTGVVRTGGGPGAPVVLLAGGSANAATWSPLLPAFAGHPVLAVDVVGEAGSSTQTARVPDAAARCRWLEETLSGAGLERVHLVGLSAGAALTLSCASRMPTRMRSVVALEPARSLAPVRPGFWWRLAAVAISGSRTRAAEFLRWCRGGTEVPEPLRELLVTALTEHRSRAVPPPERLDDRRLRAIEVPTLVVVGARSPVHDVGRVADRARLIPDVEVHRVEGAAHGLFAEQPDEVGRLVSTFLRHVES
ncbi:MAG: alpha/beta hydrolase [Pseudonocardia sp.]|nr:alpha/beta hydrolase [Pseudonocardia sp.]